MLYSDEQRLEDGKRRNRIGKWKIPQRKKGRKTVIKMVRGNYLDN